MVALDIKNIMSPGRGTHENYYRLHATHGRAVPEDREEKGWSKDERLGRSPGSGAM